MLDAPTETLASKLGGAAQRAGEGTARKDGASSARRASGGSRARKSAPAAETGAPFLGSSGALRSARVAPTTPREYVSRREPGGVRIRVNSIPQSLVGRLTAGGLVLAALAAITGSLWGARAMLLRNPRLRIPSSDHIAILGNSHLTKAQLLTIFGEDVEQNILTVPMAARVEALESLPWVEHATVMRLLPNRLEVQIVERKPVAFVREGGRIGLVDGNGVLLDLSPGSSAESRYSFPVVTGVLASDLAETRAARMKLFTSFMASLDQGSAAGNPIAKHISEVDLSSPEDIRALIPSNGADILVHFGDDDFLARYRRFEKHLPEWRAQFPKLGSADMRYERDVVLEMQPGAVVPPSEAVPAAVGVLPVKVGAAKAAAPVKTGASKAPLRKVAGKPSGQPASAKVPAVKLPITPHAVLAAPVVSAPIHHSEIAFDAPVKAKPKVVHEAPVRPVVTLKKPALKKPALKKAPTRVHP